MPAHPQDLAKTRAAIDDFLASAATRAQNWTTPRAPGKWSPSQVLEHVSRSLEESAKDMQGQRSKLPQLPGPVRFLARQFLFKRVLKKAAFPKAKTNRAMDPEFGPSTVEEGRLRLEGAWRSLEEAAASAGDNATSRVFGTVRLPDYLRFQALHTRHHQAQLT